MIFHLFLVKNFKHLETPPQATPGSGLKFLEPLGKNILKFKTFFYALNHEVSEGRIVDDQKVDAVLYLTTCAGAPFVPSTIKRCHEFLAFNMI